ncbi:MAG: hypothetical protein P8105_09630, partial [Dehalococcoidia bacterium]
GTDFYDADWYKSYRQDGNCPYGLALASDGTYLWGTRTNEVWRARLTLYYGYRSSAGVEYGNSNTYFVEDWTRSRTRNASSVTFHGIDVWGLLEQYTVPGPWEVNFMSNQYNVYQLIEKVVQCIGGTLGYVSRSSLMTGLYPRMEFHPGESGDGVLRRLLQLVPDVLRFNGFNAYVIYPQAGDSYSYEYKFPAALSGEHPILTGSYKQGSYAANRAYIIGKDTEDFHVFGESEISGEIDKVGERLQFTLQTDIATAALAEDVAEAVLAAERIDAAYGSVLVPPNCGQELWDVVRINDTPCGQANADYRITAMLLKYEDRDSAYSQRLTLGGV